MTVEGQVRTYDEFNDRAIGWVFSGEAQELLAGAVNGRRNVFGANYAPAILRATEAQDVLGGVTALAANNSISAQMSEAVLNIPLKSVYSASRAVLDLKRASNGHVQMEQDQFDTILADALNPNSAVE